MKGTSISSWAQLYSESSSAPSWLEAHRWKYDAAVLEKTVLDVRRKLELEREDELLEVGAGTGGFLLAVLHDGQSGLGFDLCESMIRAGERLGIDRTRVSLGVAEGLRLPLASDSFDKVLCYSVIQHYPDLNYAEQAILEMLRVCRTGGIVMIGDVCGIMERYRRRLLQKGMPEPLADAILSMLAPARYLRWRSLRGQCEHWMRSYRRSFFQKIFRQLPCEVEFVEQNIPGRDESLGRFDVLVRKTAGLTKVAAHLVVFSGLVTSVVWLRAVAGAVWHV